MPSGFPHLEKSEGAIGMDHETSPAMTGAPSAFRFHGRWQDFAKIALPNLLLTIVTLGFYRFWGTTRERRYLWGQTQFIDERLEWTGTGKELFVGFIMVFFLIGIPFIILQLLSQRLIFQGSPGLAAAISFLMALLIFYLGGVARFRALRYRLSRSYWRGIRGGSHDPGYLYGASYMWKSIVGMIPLFLLVPWSMISLWNERWNDMSFGPYRFESTARWTHLMKRYMLFYLIPFVLVIGGIILGITALASGAAGGNPAEKLGVAFGPVFFVFLFFMIYIALPLAALAFYSKFFRVAVGGLRLHNLEFDFKARATDWIMLYLGHAAVVIVSALAFVLPLLLAPAFIRYRNWKFFVTHMEVYGEVNVDDLIQSDTEVSSHGEGLLDAFDLGAI
jgi:uncharacterized membrane protein YjgN (DUF898 family)